MYAGTWKKSKKQIAKEEQEQAAIQAQNEHYKEVAAAAEGKELITSYEEALQRRISAMRENAQMDEDYWMLMEQYQAILEMKYDVNLYNIVVVGKDMWVEPIYVTALFDGSDATDGVVRYSQQAIEELLGDGVTVTVEEGAASGGGDVYNIYYTDDYSYYPSWGLSFGWGWGPGWGVGFGWGYGGYRGWYGGWYSPWYSPWYGGWYGGWYGPGWYRPSYGPMGYNGWGHSHNNRNSRGTVYGNSEYRGSRPSGSSGIGGTRASTPSRTKATGVNTVNGMGGSRRDAQASSSTTSRVPNGSVSDNFKNNSGVVGTQTDRRGANSSSTSTSTNRNTNNRNNSTTSSSRDSSRERTTNNNTNSNAHNSYERSVSRPTSTTTNRTTTTTRSTGTSHSSGSRSMGGGRR